MSKGQKGQKKVNMEVFRDFDVENISVKLQNDKAIPAELSSSQGSLTLS